MSGPVDVLAVWDEAIANHEHHFGVGTCHGKAMRAARAAVAELIEAASPVCMALHASRMIMADKESRDYAGEICDRLKAALAAVEKLP